MSNLKIKFVKPDFFGRFINALKSTWWARQERHCSGFSNGCTVKPSAYAPLIPIAFFAYCQTFPAYAEPALAPYGHVRFCQQYPSQCQPLQKLQQFELTAARRAELEHANSYVNFSINAKIDDARDDWQIMPLKGDCDDYAVSKRALLIERGWNPSDLRLAVVQLPDGRAHLVLTVHTAHTKLDRGAENGTGAHVTLMLDNLTDEIREFPGSYRPVKWQSSTDPKAWEEVR